MRIFGNDLASRLTKIDELTRPHHRHLRDDDECYYTAEYTARGGYAYSATNDVVLNFKKEVSRRHLPDYKYKEAAIRTAALELRQGLNPEYLDIATLVPIPPSKARSDPDYDDRILRIIRTMVEGRSADVRELIVQTGSLIAYHTGALRSPDVLAEHYAIDDSCSRPEPRAIALFDDVLTTGAHFRAASSVLRERYPNVPIVGIFYARCVPPNDI